MEDKYAVEMKRMEIERIKKRKSKENECPHVCGGSSGYYNSPSAFCWLKLPTGEIVGTCLYCQKTVSSIDPKDQSLFRTHFYTSRSTMAESHQFVGELVKQLERFNPEDQLRILKEEYPKTKELAIKGEAVVAEETRKREEEARRQYEEKRQELYEMPIEQLEAIAHAELEKIRRNR